MQNVPFDVVGDVLVLGGDIGYCAIKQLLLSDKTFLSRAEKSGLAPIAGVSPFWLLCFYHKTINHGQK